MKNWIGLWLIAVSAIHTLFAVIFFKDVLGSIIADGIYNSIGNDPMKGAVVWFVLFGLVSFICGLLVSEIEKSSANHIPKSIGWTLLLLAILGVTLMPASGFWLVFPPSLAILLKKANTSYAVSKI